MKTIKHYNYKEIILNEEFDLYEKREYLEYRKNWNEYPKQRFVSDYPINLDINVTNRCNLKCIMCCRTKFAERGEEKRPEDIDLKLYKDIIDESAKEGVFAVHLTGDGEPLLHKNIIEIIEYAGRKNILDIFMNTNATLLDEDMSRAILDAGLTRLIISFDSPEKSIYETIRVGAEYEKVIENVRRFAKMKNGLKYPIIRVQMVKMSLNKQEVDEYIKLFSPLVDVIGFTEYINYFNLDDGSKEINEKKYHDGFVCYDLWRRMTVDVDGGVYACVPMPEALYLGDVHKQTIKDLWHSQRMNEMRRLYNENNLSCLKEICTCGIQWK